MFVPVKLFQPSVMKHSSLLDPFVSYEKNQVSRISEYVPHVYILANIYNLTMRVCQIIYFTSEIGVT